MVRNPGEWNCSVLVLLFTVSYTHQALQLLAKDPVSAQSPGGPLLGLPEYRIALRAEEGPCLSCPFVPFPLISLFPFHPTQQKLHVSGMGTRMCLLCLSPPHLPAPESLSHPSGAILRFLRYLCEPAAPRVCKWSRDQDVLSSWIYLFARYYTCYANVTEPAA